MSNQPPIEVPQGAIRLNTDSQRLEFFAQDRWYEFATDSPTLNGGTRGLFTGLAAIPAMNPYGVEYITIPTQGNSTDFGDMVDARANVGAFASNVRGVFGGGYSPTPDNDIDFVTIPTTGNAVNFGDMNYNSFDNTGLSNQTRGLFCGGSPSSSENDGVNNADFVTIATTGDSLDFGDLFENTMTASTGSNSVRGVIANGKSGPSHSENIHAVNIPTTGTAFDFGDMIINRQGAGGCSNAIRMVFGGGSTPTKQTSIETLLIATFGNSIQFGDLETAKGGSLGACCDKTRAVFAGGVFHPETHTNNIEYIAIATGGDAVDFGDLSSSNSRTAGASGFSNGHGGL